MVTSTAEDWSVYWKSPTIYGYDPITDDYYAIECTAEGHVRLHDTIETEALVASLIHSWVAEASDTQLKYDATEYNTSSTTYVKATEFTFDATPSGRIGTSGFRISAELKGSAGATCTAAIYKNGVIVDVLGETTGGPYVIFEEDFTGWEEGDTIELWFKLTGAGAAYVQKFRIKADFVRGAPPGATW